MYDRMCRETKGQSWFCARAKQVFMGGDAGDVPIMPPTYIYIYTHTCIYIYI